MCIGSNKKSPLIIGILKCSKWRRSDQNCPAKGKIILPHMETLWLYKSHKHCNKNKKLLATFRRTLIDRATREQTNHRVIFNEVCARPEFRSVNVPYTKFKRQMSKAKKENLPPEPNSMSAFKNQLLNDFAEKAQIDGENIFIGQTGNLEDGISLIFIVPKLKRLLRSANEFIIDGTFKASPKFHGECCQLFVIMGIYMDNGFPIVYALMNNKTETSYIHLFNYLKTIGNWNPKCISVDFEHSSIAAIKSVFSDINIHGCWFHHSQCVWRHVQKKGLTDLCRRNRTVYDVVHMLMAIPLLPKDKTFEGFQNVLQFYIDELHSTLSITNKHNMKSLLKYYYNTWIIGNLGSIMSVNNRVRRTNNHLEVSHMHLMKHIQHPHPSPWIFLEKLITFMKGIKNDFLLVQDGIEIRHEQPKKWKVQDKKIRIATKKLRYERFSVFEFLLYAKHTTPNFGTDRPMNNSFEEIEEHDITTRVIRSPNASLPTSSLLVNSSFGSDVEVNSPNATSTLTHISQISYNIEEDIQSLNTSPLMNSSFGSDIEVNSPNATSTPIHVSQISYNIEEDIQSLNTSPLMNSSFGSDIEVNSPNATSTPIHVSQISYNIEEDIQSLNTSPLMNSSFGSDVEVNSPNATSTPIHMAQINYNIEEDIQSLNTSPLMNSSLASDVEEAMFSFNTSLPAPLMVSPYNSDVEVIHSPISSPVNGSQIHFDAEDNDLQEEIELSGDSSLSLIWTPRIVMVSPPTVVTPPPEFPLLPLVPRQTVSPTIEIELNMAIRRQVCVACLNEEFANTKIFPCQHMCLCGDCVQNLQQNVCPLCRSPIEKIIIYI